MTPVHARLTAATRQRKGSPTAQVEIFCVAARSPRYNAITSFGVSARLRSGAVLPLLTALTRPVTALFVQQCIEETLDLSSRAGVTALAVADDLDRARLKMR